MFYFRPDEGFVGLFFYRLIFSFNISFYKSQSRISLTDNYFYMSVPGQVFGDTYPKIRATVNRLQYFTMKGILGQDRLSGSANVQNLTFTGIEFHVPSEVPFLKGI